MDFEIDLLFIHVLGLKVCSEFKIFVNLIGCFFVFVYLASNDMLLIHTKTKQTENESLNTEKKGLAIAAT